MSQPEDQPAVMPSRELLALARRRRQTFTFLGLFGFVMLVGLVAAGNWQGWWTIGGESVAAVVACPVQVVSEPDLTEVNVYNGTNRNGLAAAVGKELGDRGFSMLTIGTETQSKPLNLTVVIRYGPAGKLQAHTVSLEFPGKSRMIKDKRDDETVDVLIGEKYTAMVSAKKAAAAIKLKPIPDGCVTPTTAPATPVPSAS
jgi:hypothetical protein